MCNDFQASASLTLSHAMEVHNGFGTMSVCECVCSEKIREKSRSKLAAFVRLFSSQFQLFSGWSSWSYEQGITCSDPFKKVAHLQLHCWLCTGSIMLGAVLLLNKCECVIECVRVCVCVECV